MPLAERFQRPRNRVFHPALGIVIVGDDTAVNENQIDGAASAALNRSPYPFSVSFVYSGT
jgi:hypothetical protein